MMTWTKANQQVVTDALPPPIATALHTSLGEVPAERLSALKKPKAVNDRISCASFAACLCIIAMQVFTIHHKLKIFARFLFRLYKDCYLCAV